MHLRDGVVTQEVWHSLLSPESRQPWLVYQCSSRILWQKSVAEYNYDKITYFWITNCHYSSNSLWWCCWICKAWRYWRTSSCVFLGEGAHVMLTANILLTKSRSLQWHCRNSVQAFVIGRQSPTLTSHSCPGSIWPLRTLDQRPSSNVPDCVPVTPTTFEWALKAQLPLQLHYAITIHKSQGQAIPRAVIDIGKSELSVRCRFVAVSRQKKAWTQLISSNDI